MAEISLEALANTIEVLSEGRRETLKIARIEGYVARAEGGIKDYSHKNRLRIYLNPKTQVDEITQLNFYGTSPVRAGDKIGAGIILNEIVKGYGGAAEAFYVEIIDERGNYLRRDFRDNCEGPWFNRDLGLDN